jgi:hypothetical protein
MDKSYIFAEVRRLAQQNGGKPPGRRQFYSLTHTRERDWMNKPWNSWNNWGDVLEEAGFQRLEARTKFDSSRILKELALLTRKLNRLPVTADMRREKRQNEDFPNDKVFLETFGSRERALAALIQFCKCESEFTDIVPVLTNANVTTGFRKSAISSEGADTGAKLANFVVGSVYLFKSDKQYKIGSSRAVYRRLSELINQSALGGKPIHIIQTDDPEGIERYWHKRFESSRIVAMNKSSGEWFLLSPSDVAAFKRRKTM